MSDSKRCKFRNMLSEIQVIIIDKTSMVSKITFLHTHHRFCETFGCNYDKPFPRKTVLVVGDLPPLPPVKSCIGFTPINGPLGDMFSL